LFVFAFVVVVVVVVEASEIPELIFMLKDGRTWPSLFFHRGGSKDFLQQMRKYFLFCK
jgi:hypothetical protein